MKFNFICTHRGPQEQEACSGQVAKLVGASSRNGGFHPHSGLVWEATDLCFSLTSMRLPLPSSLSKINNETHPWVRIWKKVMRPTGIQAIEFYTLFWLRRKGLEPELQRGKDNSQGDEKETFGKQTIVLPCGEALLM